MEYALSGSIGDIEKAAAKALGVGQTLTGTVEVAHVKTGADFALPCFALAAQLKQNPAVIAGELASKLHLPAIKKSEASGGYVNIWLDPQVLAKSIQTDVQSAKRNKIQYGEYVRKNPQTVVVEFPSPNMAKPFSIGHLRPAIQGWAMQKLERAVGNKVITDDHLGDSGTPFGKWVVGFLHHSSEEKLAEGGVHELARVYIQITKDLKQEAEAGGSMLANEVQDWLTKLEQGDAQALDYNKRFAKLSLTHIHHIYKRLGIGTDYAMGEAGFVAPGKKLIAEYVQKGIAEKQADSSVIIKLDGFETPMLVQKSNGTANYATTDIATLDYRMKHWHPDKIIHVVGAEQQFHFAQLFALAKKLGYTNTEFVHYWFGIIDQINEDGTRSKMSSRKGVVLLEDLLDKAEEEAKKRASDVVQSDPESIRRIALGAVKFNDLAQDKKTNILFDWQTMFNLQGYSGAYVQYAAVRIGGIVGKFGKAEFDHNNDYDWAEEHELLLHIAKYPQVVKESADNYEPHRIATYVYELARAFNRFYEKTNVGAAQGSSKAARLWLVGVVADVLGHGLDMLGIQVPEKM